MGNDKQRVLQGASIANLIAWLSAGLLAAAWGSSFDSSWQPVWMRIGAFGLVSSVGLQIAAKLRDSRRLQAEKKNTERTLNKRVEAIVKHEECFGPVEEFAGLPRQKSV